MPTKTHTQDACAPPRKQGPHRLWLLPLAVVGAFIALIAAPVGVSAAPYPMPTHENGTINRTECRVGDTVEFKGTGYMPRTNGSAAQRLAVSDNEKHMGTTPVAPNGTFTYTFRIKSNTSLGKHTYVARGVGANGAPRDTTAVCHVVGVEQRANGVGGGDGSGGGDGRGGSLPFTGADLFSIAVVAALMTALGVLLVRQSRTSRRHRRRSAAA